MDFIQFELKKLEEERLYRAYMGDSIYAYTHGKAFKKKYTALIDNTPEKSGDEIAEDFIKKLMKGGNDNKST